MQHKKHQSLFQMHKVLNQVQEYQEVIDKQLRQRITFEMWEDSCISWSVFSWYFHYCTGDALRVLTRWSRSDIKCQIAKQYNIDQVRCRKVEWTPLDAHAEPDPARVQGAQDDPHKLTIVFSLSERGRSTPMNTCCPTVSATCPTELQRVFHLNFHKTRRLFMVTGRLLPSRLSQALLLAPPPTTNTQQTKQNIVV